MKFKRTNYKGWIFELPFVYPSRNVTEPMHWAKRKRLHDKYQEDVAMILKAQEIHLFKCPVKIFIDLCFKTKSEHRRDFDNWQPKWLLDSMVKLGILPDDNSKVVTATDIIFIDKEPQNKTVVKIEVK